jgi:low affinity Fe/Cu permease
MEITITLKDTADGQVEIEETRLPFSGEKADSVTTATALADELQKCVDKLGEIETTACGVPVSDDQASEWEEVCE